MFLHRPPALVISRSCYLSTIMPFSLIFIWLVLEQPHSTTCVILSNLKLLRVILHESFVINDLNVWLSVDYVFAQ